MKKIRDAWQGRMTPRERFHRQMHYQTVDRCFNMEFGYWDENFSQWRMFAENGITNNEEADRFFSFDPMAGISGNVWIWPLFEEKVLEARGDKLLIQNADGLMAEVSRNHSSIPHYIKSPIETPEDWEKIKRERLRIDDPARIEAVGTVAKKLLPELDTIRRNRELIRLRTTLPESFDTALPPVRRAPDWKRITGICQDNQFKSILKELPPIEEDVLAQPVSQEEFCDDLFAFAAAQNTVKTSVKEPEEIQGELF